VLGCRDAVVLGCRDAVVLVLVLVLVQERRSSGRRGAARASIRSRLGRR
jgi:hypothetical protein